MKEQNNILTKQDKINNLNIFVPGMVIFIPAIIIALIELTIGLVGYEQDMNIIKFVSSIFLKYKLVNYFMYIVVLVGTFPLVLLLFKKHGISLKAELIPDKRKVINYIFFGLIAGIVTSAIRFTLMHILAGIPLEKNDNSIAVNILFIMSLVLVSGFFKEILFRGIPRIFLQNQIGEWTAFLIANICFAILDWPNLGLSFIFGTVWYLFYRKQKSLLVPIIAHGFHNLFGLLVSTGLLAFIGIIPQ